MQHAPIVTNLSLYDDGTSLSIRLTDGSFIMIDGGTSDEAYLYNEKILTEHLKKYSDANKPKIAAWIITHYHLDHVDFAADYLTRHVDDIEVCAFLENGYGDEPYPCAETVERWRKATSHYPNAIRHTLVSGETVCFPGVEMRVLLSERSRAGSPSELLHPGPNSLSAALYFKFDTGRTFTVHGDCTEQRLTELLTYPESPVYQPVGQRYSDILQVAHHGFPYSGPRYYKTLSDLHREISPKVAFFTVSREDFTNDYRYNDPKYVSNRVLLDDPNVLCLHHEKSHSFVMAKDGVYPIDD
jgi:beta-lactamase superfamily II metal-dependent hydrolase